MRTLVLVLLASAALFAQGAARRAPGFALVDLKTQVHDLGDYRGKVVLVDFMKTDCPHCKTFAAILEKAKARYGARVAVLSIVMPPDTTATVERFVNDNNLTTPYLFDCGQVAYSYIRPKTSSISLPHLYIVDREGMIVRDYEYSPDNKGIFEGGSLFTELDRLAGPPASRY
jgi:peroxiredoxin